MQCGQLLANLAAVEGDGVLWKGMHLSTDAKSQAKKGTAKKVRKATQQQEKVSVKELSVPKSIAPSRWGH